MRYFTVHIGDWLAGVDLEAWGASNRTRRSKRVGAWTERAWSLAGKAGEQKGLSPAEMLDYCISRGWASSRAEYYDERPHAETPEELGLRVAREMILFKSIKTILKALRQKL